MLCSWANHAVSWSCVSFLCTMMERVIKSVERGNATTYGKACHRCWSGMDGYDEQVQVHQLIFPLTPHLTDPEARTLWREKNCTVLQEHRIVNIYHETWQTRFAIASILKCLHLMIAQKASFLDISVSRNWAKWGEESLPQSPSWHVHPSLSPLPPSSAPVETNLGRLYQSSNWVQSEEGARRSKNKGKWDEYLLWGLLPC